MNYAEFQQLVKVSKQDICRESFAENRKKIKVKKEKTVVKNLERIFDATLKISNEKGFQAMSMRDLSRETGLSLGALYGYSDRAEPLPSESWRNTSILKWNRPQSFEWLYARTCI